MRYLFSVLCCFFVHLVFGQNSSLLWEISGKGLKHPSFLYGTMHVKDERVFRFGDSVMVKFSQCKALVGELDMDMDSKELGEIMELSMMPKDTTLDMLLSKEDYDFIKKQAKEKLGSMGMLINRMKPFLSSALFTEEGMKKDSTKSLDAYLQSLARSKGMKVAGLETVLEQMKAIDQVSLKEQAQMLLASVKDQEKSNASLEEMFQYYLAQDLDGIEKYMNNYDLPESFNRSILIRRNYVMADRIPKTIKKQATFIAVGAAHLPGKEGLIELLRKKGYTVRPVISTFSGSNKEMKNPEGFSTIVAAKEWRKYTSDQFEVYFPGEPKINEESDQKVLSVYALQPNTSNLFSLTAYTRMKEGETADKYFQKVLEEFKSGKSVVVSNSKFESEGIPAMEVEVKEGITYIRMKYYFLEDRTVELAVTADKNEVRSESSEMFFNSFKIIKP